jgi:hypothetical protein
MTTVGHRVWGRFNELNRRLRDRIAIIISAVVAFLKARALLRWFTELNRKSHGRIAIIIIHVLAFLSAPALALMSYGVYIAIGAGTAGHRGSHEIAIPVAATSAIQTNWDIQTNRENKGDRIIPSPADTVRMRFVFDDIANDPVPEKVPLPRPRPDELIALDSPPIDLQPALDRNKRGECQWDKLKGVRDAKLETLPDFMRSCVGPPIQLTPPER